MSQPIRGQGGHLWCQIGPKSLTWKRILRFYFLSSFVKRNWNCLSQSERSSWFSDRTETNMVEDVEYSISLKIPRKPFSSCREVEKYVGQSEARATILIFPIGSNLAEDIEILLLVKFHCILFSGCRGEVENVSANRSQGDHLCFLIDPKNTHLVENLEYLLPIKFRKCLSQSEARAAI